MPQAETLEDMGLFVLRYVPVLSLQWRVWAVFRVLVATTLGRAFRSTVLSEPEQLSLLWGF